MQLYRHAVSSRIDLGKLSTLPSVLDLEREEGGDCGGEKKLAAATFSFFSLSRKAMLLKDETKQWAFFLSNFIICISIKQKPTAWQPRKKEACCKKLLLLQLLLHQRGKEQEMGKKKDSSST